MLPRFVSAKGGSFLPKMKIFYFFILLSLPLRGGPFPGAAGTLGSDAVSGNDARFLMWAAGASVLRGPTDLADPAAVLVSYGAEADAIGAADADPNAPYPVVSLGDGGSAVLTFPQAFCDVPGVDFVVFENGFSAGFLELAHVEVSSDGVNFFRFPSTSLTPAGANLGQGGSVDPTNIDQLAGKYLAGFGTPFDLARLPNAALLDKARVTHVRLIDVVGTSSAALGSVDSAGRVIVDPYPTDFFSGGFDLDAVGVFSVAAGGYAQWVAGQGRASASPYADPLGLGVPQGVEFFTGGTNVSVDGTGSVSFDWLSYRVGGRFRIEASSDLVGWQVLAESVSGGAMVALQPGVSVALTGGMKKRVVLNFSPGGQRRFFRLAAE